MSHWFHCGTDVVQESSGFLVSGATPEARRLVRGTKSMLFVTKKNTSINLYEQILFLLSVGHNVDCNTVRIFAYARPGFNYARAVKQKVSKVSNEAELLISRKKSTVLQSSL